MNEKCYIEKRNFDWGNLGLLILVIGGIGVLLSFGAYVMGSESSDVGKFYAGLAAFAFGWILIIGITVEIVRITDACWETERIYLKCNKRRKIK